MTGNNEVVNSDGGSGVEDNSVSPLYKKQRRSSDEDKLSNKSQLYSRLTISHPSAESLEPNLSSTFSTHSTCSASKPYNDPPPPDPPDDEPPSWYPGWEKAAILKERYLREHTHVRPEGYMPPPRLPICGSAADVDVKEQFIGLGIEILDDEG